MSGTLDLTGYKLTFDDEFNNFSASAGSTDLSKPLNATWQTQFFWGARFFGANGEQQFYSDSSTGTNPFTVQNGALDITAAPGSNSAGQPYNSGMINSYHTFSQTYGYFEMRAKLPEGQGMWPAFWLLPENGGTGEIDAMEAFGAKASDGEGGSNQVHWADHFNSPSDTGNWATVSGNIYTGYHTYGVDWEPDTTTWYVDGHEVAQVATPANANNPMYIIANLAVGGSWPGSANGETSHMDIDYIRAYSKDPNATAVALQPISSPDGVNTTPTGATFANNSPTPAPAPTPTPAPAPAPAPAPSANNGDPSITLHVSGDHWAGHTGGDPQFVVLVDGQQVGGVQTVSAVHDAGQWQDITVNGTFSNSPHEVDVKFINDAYGGSHAQDVNLYVDSITVGGHTYTGTGAQATNSASGGYTDSTDPNAAIMVSDGTLAFDTSASPTPTPAPTPAPAPAPAPTPAPAAGTDSVTLHVSGDHWAGHTGGDPQFVVLVDGQQVGGVQTVSAVHDNGQWQDITVNGNFTDPHAVDVKFINDAYGGSHAQDVNLYVDSIAVDGHTYAGAQATNSASGGYTDPTDPNAAMMVWNGTLAFDTSTSSSMNSSPSLPSMGSSTGMTTPAAMPEATPAATPAAAPAASAPMAPSFSDGAGHDVFMFTGLNQAGAEIANFQPSQDVLDLVPLMKAIGYTGHDPLADHVVDLAQTASGGTAVTIDPTGHDPAHGTTLVTLDHVLPQDVHASNIWS